MIGPQSQTLVSPVSEGFYAKTYSLCNKDVSFSRTVPPFNWKDLIQMIVRCNLYHKHRTCRQVQANQERQLCLQFQPHRRELPEMNSSMAPSTCLRTKPQSRGQIS
mmetsp:Transcript_109698/g.274817  ORF Transcript_109698/g.274817 Transcript_109698/m.274817 type:complete len:106 (-) Transcript_109698:1167-1484(-)